MKIYTATATLIVSLGSGIALAADCVAPEKPPMPDGANASLEEMLAGQKAVKAFQAGNVEYMKCLEGNFMAAEANAKESPDPATRAIAAAEYDESFDAYNAAVSAEEEVAGEFNVELRAYKAANAK